jgi:hypothetical protein
MTRFDLDYVIVPETVVEPVSDVLARLTPNLSGSGPIVVCRRVGDGMPLDRMPVPASEVDGRPVDETWSTSLAWLERAVTTGLDDAVAARLIVRVPWPPDIADETTLLMAKLSAPSLRLAVEIDPPIAEDAFHYLNRLEQRWIAVPGRIDAAYVGAMVTLGRFWLFDPRTRTPMEPVVNALGAVFGDAVGHGTPPWRVHVTHAADGRRTAGVRWTPSLHAALRAGVAGDDLERFGALDGQWIDALKDLCATVDVDALRALAATAGAGGRTS